jgi:hypothetical protein
MAEPIALPLLSSQRHVKLPAAPMNPPGPTDITNALKLTNDLLNARSESDSVLQHPHANIFIVGRDEVTDKDVCNGALYQHKLISATALQGQQPLFCETHHNPTQQQRMANQILFRPCSKLWSP